MKYLKSVNSYWDEKSGMIYMCQSNECRDTDNGHPIGDMDDEWWDRLSPADMSRIDVGGGLY